MMMLGLVLTRAPVDRAFMGIIDTKTGEGTLHCQTKEQRGRKYWAWGNDPGDLNRLYFLSSCEGGESKTECLGAYLETQSGVVPTQDQFFALPVSPFPTLLRHHTPSPRHFISSSPLRLLSPDMTDSTHG